MDIYSLEFEQFHKLRPWRFNRVPDLGSLNQLVASEVVGRLKEAARKGRRLMVICPVGPLNYQYWVEKMHQEHVDGSFLVTVNMDEYLHPDGHWIDETHPLSFRRYMQEELFSRLKGKSRIPKENTHFPNPHAPEETTRLIEQNGGADLCYGGMGLTGHFAFNDPPARGEKCIDSEVRNSRTRTLRISRESQAQMCMGGTGGNWEILPQKAVTLGMYELLSSKRIHLTFMRSWHAGVLRRALFGPVSGRCPGSFVQEHPNLEITLTELAASLPLTKVAQRVAE